MRPALGENATAEAANPWRGDCSDCSCSAVGWIGRCLRRLTTSSLSALMKRSSTLSGLISILLSLLAGFSDGLGLRGFATAGSAISNPTARPLHMLILLRRRD